jgi:hypothetical protein
MEANAKGCAVNMLAVGSSSSRDRGSMEWDVFEIVKREGTG